MELTRRDFLKLCGGTAAGAAILGILDPESFLEAAPIDIPLEKELAKNHHLSLLWCMVWGNRSL